MKEYKILDKYRLIISPTDYTYVISWRVVNNKNHQIMDGKYETDGMFILEYDSGTDRYPIFEEKEDWLQFINILNEAPKVIEENIVEIRKVNHENNLNTRCSR